MQKILNISMSENPPNQPPNYKPLPRFKPVRPAGTKTMTSSISVPNFKSKVPSKPKKVERTPQREREKKYIDLGPMAPSSQKFADTFNSIPKSQSEFIDTRMDDVVQNEGELAVTLPLVPSTNAPPTAEKILAPSRTDKVMLVQLPSALPIQYPNDSIKSFGEGNPLFSSADGRIGKLRIHKSGKVTAEIGNIVLDVSSGISPSCTTLMCVKRESGLDYFTIPNEKLKFSVDIETLLNTK